MKQVRERGATSELCAAPVDPLRTKTEPIYVVECEPHELPIFRERVQEYIPSHNRSEISNLVAAQDKFTRHDGMHVADWYGGLSTFTEAERLVRDGWTEGAERARSLAEELRGLLPDPESARRVPCWAEEGDELDRDRLYGGNIDRPWRATSRVTRRGPRTLTLVGKWSFSWSVSADRMAWTGAAMIALADLLEQNGYACGLSLAAPCHMYPGSKPNSSVMPIVRLKAPHDPLNPASLAGVACHVGIFRSYGFLMIGSTDTQVDGGLGTPTEVQTIWEQAHEAGMVEPADAYIEQALSKDQAVREMKRVLKQLFPAMDGLETTPTRPRAFGEV